MLVRSELSAKNHQLQQMNLKVEEYKDNMLKVRFVLCGAGVGDVLALTSIFDNVDTGVTLLMVRLMFMLVVFNFVARREKLHVDRWNYKASAV